MKLDIIIRDIAENKDGSVEVEEVEVQCVGDTIIKNKATSAQILANKCMEFIAKELKA